MASPEQIASLRRAFIRLLSRYSISPIDADHIFEILLAAYSAPDRFYHNLEHLIEMFAVAGRLALFCDDPYVVQLAIWFHDAVYDPRGVDNENRSAELAALLLGPLGVPAGVLERLTRMIRLTSLSQYQPPGDRDTAALLDADLAILGTNADRYHRYAADIRREYGWLSDAEYAVARQGVLQHLLNRTRIYSHELIFLEREYQARINLTEEITRLTTDFPQQHVFREPVEADNHTVSPSPYSTSHPRVSHAT